jgi:hypothetical protein
MKLLIEDVEEVVGIFVVAVDDGEQTASQLGRVH